MIYCTDVSSHVFVSDCEYMYKNYTSLCTALKKIANRKATESAFTSVHMLHTHIYIGRKHNFKDATFLVPRLLYSALIRFPNSLERF